MNKQSLDYSKSIDGTYGSFTKYGNFKSLEYLDKLKKELNFTPTIMASLLPIIKEANIDTEMLSVVKSAGNLTVYNRFKSMYQLYYKLRIEQLDLIDLDVEQKKLVLSLLHNFVVTILKNNIIKHLKNNE